VRHASVIHRTVNSGHHYGEVACRDFRESVVMTGLPHQWREREDTRLQLAHFRHHRPAKAGLATS
jgi:hypothetical protein